MIRLFAELRQLRADYRRVKSPGDDLADIAAALAFTVWTLALAADVVINIGG